MHNFLHVFLLYFSLTASKRIALEIYTNVSNGITQLAKLLFQHAAMLVLRCYLDRGTGLHPLKPSL